MTGEAVRSVRRGDGQVAYRVVGSGPSEAWVPVTIAGCAATIVTVHEFSSRQSNSLVPFGRVGHRDAIEEARRRGAARGWMKRSPLASQRIFERESDNDLLSQPGATAPHFRKEA